MYMEMQKMKKSLAVFALLLLALSVSVGQVGQQNGKQAEQEVRKLEREWLNAYERRDSVAMNRIVAGDFTITYQNGSVETKNG